MSPDSSTPYSSYKHLFGRFLSADPGRRHFAAHSHHPWPDVTLEAQERYWHDSVRLADEKWGGIFDAVLPEARAHIARVLNLSDPTTIAFAPSTHELVLRLLSCFPGVFPLRIVTTGSEFHSFHRQSRRLAEDGEAALDFVPVEPFADFSTRFIDRMRAHRPHVVYLSQVFYDSAFRVEDLEEIASAAPEGAYVVIDGYHGFMAVPTDLSAIEKRVFYVAGGYKYAMSGEGACFMHCPPGYGERPVNTGWFATFDRLSTGGREEKTPYPTSGMRFQGATFDPVGIYRLNAVFGLLVTHGITVDAIHDRVRSLQRQFLDELDRIGHPALRRGTLVPGSDVSARGNFLTFRLPDAGEWHRKLREASVVTDWRRDRLRIGFGIYHDPEDVSELASIVSGIR